MDRVPMYYGKRRMKRELPNQYYSPYVSPHSASHPSVPWEGRDWSGQHSLTRIFTVHPIPLCGGKVKRDWDHGNLYHSTYQYPLGLLSIPSHFILGIERESGNISNSTTLHAFILTIHSTPMYRGKRMEWKHSNLYYFHTTTREREGQSGNIQT